MRKKAYAVLFLGLAFLFIHFIVYAPRFPEFYWS